MEEIIDSYLFCINKKISEAPFNKDEKARILAKNTNKTYDILMNGVEYFNVKCKDQNYVVNQVVTVKIPKNNYNNMYIMSETSSSGGGGGGSGGGGDLNIVIVSTLPTEDISTTTIYLVPKTSTTTNNAYIEYLYIEDNWEIIGDTDFSSDSYYDKDSINELLLHKLDTDFANIDYADINVANINQLFAKDGVIFNLTADNVTIDDAVIGDLIAPNITSLDLTSGSILTTDFTIQSSTDTDSGLKIADNTMQFFNDEGEVGIQLGYDTNNNPSLIIKDENGSIMLDSDGLHDNIVPNGFIKETMVGDSQITDSKIDWESTLNVVDDDGNKLWLTSSQVLNSQEFTTKFTEINDTTDGLESRTSTVEQTVENLNSTVSETVVKANNAYTSLVDEYAVNQSATTAPTAGWSTIPPQWQDGYYMWRRTITIKGDGTTTTSTPVNISGSKGKTGETGEQLYTWIKYATSSTGADMSDDSTGKSYIGLAYNKTISTESTTASDYTWSLFKGESGTDGVGVDSIEPQYYLSTSKETQIDGEWVTDETSLEWEVGKYLWHRSKITYTNNSVEYVGLYVDTSWEASSTYYNSLILITDSLQNQVDGTIDSWFYEGTPTLLNAPASEWETDTIKDRHIGDTYTNVEEVETSETAGQSFRFVKENDIYKWIKISDNDAVLALQRASQAQSTADGKSTTYINQPTSYKEGDGWILAETLTLNDIEYSVGTLLVSVADSDTFNESDWEEKVKYTDNTEVDNLKPLIETNSSAINQLSDKITFEVEEQFATKDEVASTKSVILEQTAENLTITKNSLTTDITNVGNSLINEIKAREEFIRFDGASMELGQSDSPFGTVLDNTKLAFTENGQTVASVSNQKLNITSADIEVDLQIGNFKWQPRSNGNLSLVWIGG